MVKTMLIPEAWRKTRPMPEAHRDLYGYCNAVMEPWDGPAAICAYGGRWAIAGMDRNGLRPDALYDHRRRLAVRRLGDRHGAPARGTDGRKGPLSGPAR